MKIHIVYFDTSVFLGLLEDDPNRTDEANKILAYEQRIGSHIYTSVLTLNEYMVKVYDAYHANPNCQQEIEKKIEEIGNIANFQGLSRDILTESARLISAYGRHNHIPQPSAPVPRARKMRWDSLHLATANILGADRAYAWDEGWHNFPRNEMPKIGNIISPAQSPEAGLF